MFVQIKRPHTQCLHCVATVQLKINVCSRVKQAIPQETMSETLWASPAALTSQRLHEMHLPAPTNCLAPSQFNVQYGEEKVTSLGL